jgi:hypothetical protein
VVSISPSVAWESESELVGASDAVLSASIQNFSEEEKEPSKTVFAVPGYWVERGQIKAEYLEKIKKICSELSLTPVGFVVLAEAIGHYIKAEEGSPLNGIVLGLGKEDIEISVFRLGNIAGSFVVARSVSVVDDIVEGLSRFSTSEPFPSRFVLYNGKEGELEEVRQALNSADWSKQEKVRFLHTPKIEIIKPEDKILATALAGGAELANTTSVQDTSIKPDRGEAQEEKPSQQEEVSNVVEASDMGFVVGEDIKKASDEIMGEENLPPNPSLNQPHQARTDSFGPVQSVVDKTPQAAMPEKKPKFASPAILKKVKQLLFRLPQKAKASKDEIPTQRSTKGKKPFVIGGVVLLLFLAAAFFYWWYVPRATVTIYVTPQKLEEKTDISINPNITSVDLGSMTVPGNVVKKEESGDKTKSTTGTKTVGERAKGEVTIYRSGSQLSLDAGTKMKDSSNLEFTLDNDVEVASGSASKPGTTKAAVTAVDIGAEYNLAAQESFSISNYPTADVEAKNESAFSGGSSREISAVAEADQEALSKDLTDELEQKARDEFSGSMSEDEYLVGESLTSKIVKEDFSAKVGDEADNLKLSLTLETSAVVVKKDDLYKLAREVLANKVTSGYALRDDQISLSFAFNQQENGIYKMSATFTANLLPQINVDDIAKKIAGKYPDIAQEYLTKIEGFDKAKVDLKPNFTGKLGSLPRVVGHINIEIEALH